MAENSADRTEAATPRRRQRARESGQVALSPEAAPACVLATAALLLGATAPGDARRIAATGAALLSQSYAMTPAHALALAAFAAVKAAAPLLLASLAAGSIAVLGQTGFMVNFAALKPGFGRLDPRRNMRRIAGPEAFGSLGKSLLKLSVASWAVYHALTGAIPLLGVSALWSQAAWLGHAAGLIGRVMLSVALAQAGLAGLDIVRVHLAHARRLRMSRQEVRDELRESEGNPQVKARTRRLRRQRARRRMLSAVPKATVVVTNPTHYAVALAYQRGSPGAPRVVAKGIDTLAARIRVIAEESRVPVISNPPLARALWRIELDTEIPVDLFKAVAEIIAYVWRLSTPASR